MQDGTCYNELKATEPLLTIIRRISMSATPPATTNASSLVTSLYALIPLLSLVASGVWAYSGLDKKIELLDQRVDIVSAQIQTYQIERKEDSKRIEEKLDKISVRIDALIVKGVSK